MSNIDLTQLVSAQDKTATLRTRKYAALAELRWQRETGGLTLNGGQHILTTRESQMQIASTVQSIQAGLITGPVDWKCANGWVQFAPQDILAIAQAVTSHVKRCFAAERHVFEQIQAQTGDVSQIDIAQAFEAALAELA